MPKHPRGGAHTHKQKHPPFPFYTYLSLRVLHYQLIVGRIVERESVFFLVQVSLYLRPPLPPPARSRSAHVEVLVGDVADKHMPRGMGDRQR